jgi:pilus assembly protein Flp/PilA
MNRILLRLRRSLRTTLGATRDRGASAVEYGLLVAAIAALIVGTVFALGGYVKSSFDKTCEAINSQVNPGCSTTGT